jgi:hypothetical protein
MSLIPLDVQSQLLEKLANALKSVDADSLNVNLKSQDMLMGVDIQGDAIGFTGTPDAAPPASGVVLLGYDGTYVRRVKTTSDGKLVLWLG